MSKNREIEILEEAGRKVALVPLGRDGTKGQAEIWLDDYLYLTEKLRLSGNWNKSPSGVVKAPLAKAPGQSVAVARVLLDAGEQQAVFYKDPENKTNLRRENLELRQSGMGVERARKHLPIVQEVSIQTLMSEWNEFMGKEGGRIVQENKFGPRDYKHMQAIPPRTEWPASVKSAKGDGKIAATRLPKFMR